MDEVLVTDGGREFSALLFEYSDKSAPVKASALKLHSVILAMPDAVAGLKPRDGLRIVSSGVRYLIKEISVSGVDVFEITLERMQADLNEAITHGKF